METITLQYNQAIKEQLMKFLETFSKKDLEIIEEHSGFDQVKEELHRDYNAYKNGDTKLLDIEDFEKEMNEIFPEK